VANVGEWNALELESARSSLIFELVEAETTLSDAVVQSVLRSFRGVDIVQRKEILTRVQAVSEDDLKRVGQR
jgi:hypothetical protein